MGVVKAVTETLFYFFNYLCTLNSEAFRGRYVNCTPDG